MITLFSAIQQVRMIILQITAFSGYQPGLQAVKQPVVTGMIPFDKKGINTMILYPAK